MNPRSKRKTQKSKSSNKTGHVLLLLSPVHHHYHFRSAGATSVISPAKGNARRHFCTIPYHSRPLVQKKRRPAPAAMQVRAHFYVPARQC